MRLLDTDSLQLKNFVGHLPKYAILSHTWLDADEEVTLEDLKDLSKAQSKQGYAKLRDSAHLAKTQGYKYIWIDTCCIDKSSSAELSEAINSMYRWYQDADVCYAYLSDVDAQDGLETSLWFTRGWTLQELVAPMQVHFYSAAWEHIGSKSQLEDVVQTITQIPKSVLGGAPLSSVSAACKMSWAADRVTTRPEDVAYCLMGLLGVNMPLLYGEGGEKAFIRLQEEFLKAQDDESIFAWKASGYSHPPDRPYWGILATSPSCFSGGYVIQRPIFKTRIHHHPTTITNRGISVELSLCPFPGDKSGTIYIAILDASTRTTRSENTPPSDLSLAILLQRVSAIENVYVRIKARLLVEISANSFTLPASAFSPAFVAMMISPAFKAGMTGSIDLHTQDPESRLIFVRSAPPVSEALAGFYTLPDLIMPVERGYQVSVVKCSQNWMKDLRPDDFEYCPYRMLRIDGHLPDMFKAEYVKSRRYLGAIELKLARKPNPGTRKPDPVTHVIDITLCLVVGLEPLPENPFGTPPTFIKPWYALVPRSYDPSWIPEIVSRGDKILEQYSPEFRLSLKAQFSTIVRYERLFYKIDLTLSRF